MSETKGNRFTKYFAPLLDALRATDPEPMRPAAARAWVRSNINVPEEDLTRFMTPDGRTARLTHEDAEALCLRVRNTSRQLPSVDEDNSAAPGSADLAEASESYWLAGPGRHRLDDQMPRFLRDSIWENGYDETYAELVLRMKPGDRIAIKRSSVRARDLPFDVGGKRVSVMRIIATGTIIGNPNDGKAVKVAWDPPFEPRDWYFYMFVDPVVKVDPEIETARRLIDFIFRGEPQDYEWFLAQPYWAERYRDAASFGSADAGSSGSAGTSGHWQDVAGEKTRLRPRGFGRQGDNTLSIACCPVSPITGL